MTERETLTASLRRNVVWRSVKTLYDLIGPWFVLGYVWCFGLHWAALGLAATVVAAVIFVAGQAIGESKR